MASDTFFFIPKSTLRSGRFFFLSEIDDKIWAIFHQLEIAAISIVDLSCRKLLRSCPFLTSSSSWRRARVLSLLNSWSVSMIHDMMKNSCFYHFTRISLLKITSWIPLGGFLYKFSLQNFKVWPALVFFQQNSGSNVSSTITFAVFLRCH